MGKTTLQKIYYGSEGLWKGYAAVDKLAEAGGVSKEEARKFLNKQALWQIYLPAQKYVPRPFWTVDKPNKVHQADLLFLPHDVIGKKTYKYALVMIGVASRYKDAEALTSKSLDEVARAFKKIYLRKLKWPESLVVDPGSEFKGSVSTLMKERGVIIKRSAAGNHRAQLLSKEQMKLWEKKSSVINMPKKWSTKVVRESE